MQKFPFTKLQEHLPLNTFTIRTILLLLGLLYIALSSDGITTIDLQLDTEWTPQYDVFVGKCTPACEAAQKILCNPETNDDDSCQNYCVNITQTLSYYVKFWTRLAQVCDRNCLMNRAKVCSKQTTCFQLCQADAEAISTTIQTAVNLPDTIYVTTGASFWATLIVFPLATADLFVTINKLAPMLQSTSDENKGDSNRFFAKVITLTETPSLFLVLCKTSYEIKVLLFDDSDGKGLKMTIALILLVMLVEKLSPILMRWKTSANSQKVAPPQSEEPPQIQEEKESQAIPACSTTSGVKI